MLEQVSAPGGHRPFAAHVWLREALLPGETRTLFLFSLIVGIGSGTGAVIFRYLIKGFDHFFFDIVQPAVATLLGGGAIVVIPALGGAIFGPLIYFFAREAKGHGVPEVMLAVTQHGGKIRPIVALIKALASALCIGSGGSVGREGPIVQIGSALGSTVGQIANASESRTRTLVACGAAGGIAATFNAPIAGVFFALELILREFSPRSFGVVGVASITASIIGRAAFGNSPSFPVSNYELVSVAELPLYAVLAIVAALVGVVFTKALYWFEDRWDAIPIIEFIKPIPGGLILGAIALATPQILGTGYEFMEKALAGDYSLYLLAALVLLKIVAVSTTIGSGGSGGVFAPSLYIGAMLGTAFGVAADHIAPMTIAPAGAYGLVGMAAVFAGAAHAPITSVIILFELTGDYHIILPLMGAVAISTFVSESISRDSIYTLKLRRRGIDLSEGRDVDIMRMLTVAQAMTTEVPVADGEITVTGAAEILRKNHRQTLVVVDREEALIGIIKIRDIQDILLDNRPGATLAEVASRPVITALPQDSLSDAIRRMGQYDYGQLPVVDSLDHTKVIGMLRRSDIVHAYSATLMNRLDHQREHHHQLQDIRETRLVEFEIPAEHPMIGHQIRDLHLTPDAVIIAIDRNNTTIIPRGHTELRARDRLQILARESHIDALWEQLGTYPEV